MLLEQAWLLHESKIVGIKGIWVDPNKQVHEGRLLEINRDNTSYRLVIEGLWGTKPVTVSQPKRHGAIVQTPSPHAISAMDAQFGSLMLKVDHFRDDPQEWLSIAGLDAMLPSKAEESNLAVGERR